MGKKALVTGSSGFIGFSMSKKLLDEGWEVVGVDNLNTYYDKNLKVSRQRILQKFEKFSIVNKSIEDTDVLKNILEKHEPELIIHLAAQAGVRYSIKNPRAYLSSNIIGTFELLEAAKLYPPEHLMIASTSSAYGANPEMPFKEVDKSDFQVSFYAASKKATENMAHSYSHLYKLPLTVFRFFTVYGPWGRPDMALFKFTDSIISDKPIEIYNNGDMKRDFTFIDDLVEAMYLLSKKIPKSSTNKNLKKNESLSSVAPFRVVNIGNSKTEKLKDFINILEQELDKKAKKIFLPMQAGDMKETWADASLLKELTGYKPKINIREGIKMFVNWYQEFYDIK